MLIALWEPFPDSRAARSFPATPDDADKIRREFAASLVDDRLGIPVRDIDGVVHYEYPTLLVKGVKQ